MAENVWAGVLILMAGFLGFVALYDGKKRLGNDGRAFLWGVFVAASAVLNLLLGFLALLLYFLVVGTVLERSTVECEACGRIFRPGDRFCRSCGAELKTNTPEKHKPIAYKYCPSCRNSFSYNDNFCPECGIKLEERQLGAIPRANDEVPPGMKECPNCKARVLKREQKCWKCGKDLTP